MPIATVNPSTGDTVATFESLTPGEIELKLAAAAAAFQGHRLSSFDERARCMLRAADILDAGKSKFARLMTIEMGKPIVGAIAEVEKCALACRYYAANSARMLAEQPVPTSGGEAWISFQPIGVILAVMPWNFPFWQVFRFAAPALMAGNAGVLKHSSNVPQCALAIEDVIRRAGFADGVFQTLLVGSSAIEGIIGDPRVAAVTLTGSEGAGRSVAAASGRHLKKTVLELGGSDPFVVMPSANLDEAITTGVKARMINNGQSCIAAKRFIIHESIYDRFLSGFVERVRSVRVGDPMDERTEVGPLATADIRSDLESQVEKTIALGARALCGGKSIEGPGFYFEPTVLVDIPGSTPADEEELFGPVASVWRAGDIDDALRIANNTRFGLGASAWTRDEHERTRFVRDLDAGLVFINGMVASEPGLPFGGVKSSGYGRELGEFGIREFTNIKSVKMGFGSPAPPDTE